MVSGRRLPTVPDNSFYPLCLSQKQEARLDYQLFAVFSFSGDCLRDDCRQRLEISHSQPEIRPTAGFHGQILL